MNQLLREVCVANVPQSTITALITNQEGFEFARHSFSRFLCGGSREETLFQSAPAVMYRLKRIYPRVLCLHESLSSSQLLDDDNSSVYLERTLAAALRYKAYFFGICRGYRRKISVTETVPIQKPVTSQFAGTDPGIIWELLLAGSTTESIRAAFEMGSGRILSV